MKKKYLSFFLLVMLVLTGCEKEEQGSLNSSDSPIELKVIWNSLADFDDAEVSDSPETRSIKGVQTFTQPLEGVDDMEVITTIENVVSDSEVLKTRAAVNNNAQFRMLIYDGTNTQLFDCQYRVSGNTVTLVSGTAPVLIAGTYKFVCYTFNTNSAINSTNTAVVSNGDDFATYCVTKTISSTNNTINVLFKRQNAQIQVTAIAVGFPNSTTNFGTVTVSNLYNTASWNVNSGSIDNIGLTGSGNGNIVCSNNGQYKIIPVNRTLSMSFSNLTIGGTNYGTKTISVPINFASQKNYKMSVQFVKKYTPLVVNGISWAPGNLKFDGTTYYFDSSQNSEGDYFGWNWYEIAVNVYNKTEVYRSDYDPCNKILPEGTWKTPSKSEFESLIGAGYSVVTSPVKGCWFSSKVFLAAGGYQKDYGSFYQKGVSGQYWTKDIRISKRAYVMSFSEKFDRPTIEDHWCSYGLNVRCVKK